MELITFKPSRNHTFNHLIFAEEHSPKSYSSLLLLNKHYKSIEEYEMSQEERWQTDWNYYFIVRRLWLRKQKQDGHWTCHYCGRHLYKMPIRNKKHQSLHNCVTVDHKVPKSEGIDILDTTNFLVSCYDCNCKKKSIPYEIFMKGILWFKENQKKKKLKEAA